MPFGNVNTQGSKGNNTPFQNAVLFILQQIASGVGGSSLSLTPAATRVTSSGTISSGKKSVSLYNSGSANGTVLGTVLKPSEIITYEVGQDSNSIGAISYDASGTEFLITTLS